MSKMTRKDRVYFALKNASSQIHIDYIEKGDIGFDAEAISLQTGLDRSNVSRELNKLVSEGLVVKIIGRPVLFFEKNNLEEIISKKLESNIIRDIKALLTSVKDAPKTDDSRMPDPFEQMIGAKSSLEIQIKQAKAAILYPPKGLHTLLTGPTGVGKTTFAEMMYTYAAYMNTISKDANFVIFNCAEYAENPQLILSQLFGHMKGAFTGAIKDKTGIVETANGGILLLDEIHRLPPEGQEMLFLLMDRGMYRKLGETENLRKANVLIIGATTEDTDSVLLKTFLRRIPMTIHLPSLSERPISERLQLIESFFLEEVNNIGVPIKVYKDVLVAALLYDCFGNIGQLRADIQLLCARGFLEYKTNNRKMIEVETTILPEHIFNGLLNYHKKREGILDFLKTSQEYYIFKKTDGEKYISINNYCLSNNLYGEIIDKYNEFTELGYSKDKINEIINSDIETYLDKLLKKSKVEKEMHGKEELFKVISPRIYHAVEAAVMAAEQKLERKISSKSIIGLSMHVSALIERIADGKVIYNEEINKIALNYPKEFKVAKIMWEVLEKRLEISIPKEEVGFLSMFLSAIDMDESNKKVGIIVVAHGDKTATSIANVTNNLLNTKHCQAIDMPLNIKVETVLEETIKKVKDVDEGKGVLLLVDMGSLTAFSEIISKKSGINVGFVDMVSTPIVIEAVRKSFIPEITLERLVDELKTMNPYMGRLISSDTKRREHPLESKTIIATCVTGRGAAVKIEKLLRNTLPFIDENKIKIKPLDITNAKNISKIIDTSSLGNIAAVVGTVDLHLPGIPFISVDELVVGEGIKKIKNALKIFDFRNEKEKLNEKGVLLEMLSKMLVFLDPKKAYTLVKNSFDYTKNELNLKSPDKIATRYLFHCCCMIERLVLKEPLPYVGAEELINSKKETYDIVKKSFKALEDTIEISVPDTEMAYIIELIYTE